MRAVLRRAVLAPAVVVLIALMWVFVPIWLILAAAISPRLPGRWRALRLLWVVMLYATAEALMLVVLCGWWLASPLNVWAGWTGPTPCSSAAAFARAAFWTGHGRPWPRAAAWSLMP